MTKAPTKFSINVLKLFSGSVVAQGMAILLAPIIARLFAPEAFGVAALLLSILGILKVISCLRYELAIMLPKNNEEGANLLAICIICSFIVTFFSTLILFLCKDLIVQLLNAPQLKKYLWLIPPAVFINGIYLTLTYWCARKLQFGSISIAQVVASSFTQGIKLIGGFAGYVTGGVLVGARILGTFIASVLLGARVWKNDGKLFLESINLKKMILLFKRYKKFPIFTVWGALLNNSTQHLPTWILAYYFYPEIVGFYSLCKAVLGLPIDILGQAISKVFFQKAAEAYHDKENLPQIVEEILKRMISISIMPLLLLTFIGKDLFIFVFGVRWAEAGSFAQIFSTLYFTMFIASPFVSLFSVLERQEISLLVNILLFISHFVSLIIGGIIGNVRLGLILLVGSASLIRIFTINWMLLQVGLPFTKCISSIAKYTIICLPILASVLLLKTIFINANAYSIILYVLSLIIYYIIILKNDIIVLKIIKQMVGINKS